MKRIFSRAAAAAIVLAMLMACTGLSALAVNAIGDAAATDVPGAATQAHSASVKYSKEEWQVLAIVNRNRIAGGLEPLTMFSGIQAACDVRAAEISDYFDHTRPDGRSCYTALDEANVPYSSAGENIAAGQTTPEAVMNAWMNSPGHRSNIMGNYRHIGIGYYYTNASYRHHWVQMFASWYSEKTNSIYLTGADGLAVKTGTKIADMGITLHEKNSVYGECICPVIDEMCTGYDAGKSGEQTVTVKFRGLTATFRVTVGQNPAPEVKLDRTSASLKVGKTLRLNATVTPAADVTWTSSDEGVATVDQSGLVTAVGVGAADITATTDSGYSASCRVTVTRDKITSLKLDKTKVTITIKKDEMGKSIKLTAAVRPAGAGTGAIKWTSSDESVATVDQNGVVTSVGFGKCTITAKATDGSGKKAKCAVTVVKKQVTSIKLSGDTRMKKGKTQTLNATIKPAKAYDQRLKWKSSNPKIAAVDQNGVVTALKKGTVTITCTARDGSRVKGTIRIKIVK